MYLRTWREVLSLPSTQALLPTFKRYAKSLILLTGCSEFALLASAGSVGLSQNSYAKMYNAVDFGVVVSTKKGIKQHAYTQGKKYLKELAEAKATGKKYIVDYARAKALGIMSNH